MPRNFSYLSLILLLLLGLYSCGNPSDVKQKSEGLANQNTDSKLTFLGVALEQFDEEGRVVWKVRSTAAKYTKETEIGAAKNPEGELYQDGKIVYAIKAETADIKQDGQQLLLRGKIIAKDTRNGVILKGNELEWRPKEDLLIVRNEFNGSHKQLTATGAEARVTTREQRVEFLGKVVANSTEPQLQMRTEKLVWFLKEEKLIGDRQIEIDRYQNNQITDRGRSNGAEVYLKTKVVTLKPQAQIQLLDPLIQIISNSITWNINQEIVKTNAPVRVIHQAENVTVTGNKAEMKIAEKTMYLTGNVNAVGRRKQSLTSNQLTWYLDKKLLDAEGNVTYRQVEPPLNFRGSTATGNLETENIVVKGSGTGNRVITEIIPQDVDQ